MTKKQMKLFDQCYQAILKSKNRKFVRFSIDNKLSNYSMVPLTDVVKFMNIFVKSMKKIKSKRSSQK